MEKEYFLEGMKTLLRVRRMNQSLRWSAMSDEEDFEYGSIKGFPSIIIESLRVLLDDPWVIMGHYLTVHPSTPNFSTDMQDLTTVAAWVRFPGILLHMYHKSILRRITSLIGRLLKIGYNTGAENKGKFARVAVELDLSKPLKAKGNRLKSYVCNQPKIARLGGSGSRFTVLDMVDSGTSNVDISGAQQTILTNKVQPNPMTNPHDRKVEWSQKSLLTIVANGLTSIGIVPITSLTDTALALQVSKEVELAPKGGLTTWCRKAINCLTVGYLDPLSQHGPSNLQVEVCVPTITTLDQTKHSVVIPKDKAGDSSAIVHVMDNRSTRLTKAESSGGVILSKGEEKQSSKIGNIRLQRSSLKKKARAKHNGSQSFSSSLSLLKEKIIQPSINLKEGKVDVGHGALADDECQISLVKEVNMEREKDKPALNLGLGLPSVKGREKSQLWIWGLGYHRLEGEREANVGFGAWVTAGNQTVGFGADHGSDPAVVWASQA
ncbi:Uncharacterized protein TCM_022639 [Theobroma cacao]|uniref:Uncharacterized protein n=1 Tax=Theobroma cacao TaxID=3641 RepID=A0A061EU14_THECC|nr:Uncharacterized protein TCM_022639 [Theobroma cacao]